VAAPTSNGTPAVVPLDPKAREQVEAIATLHTQTLPGSVPARLGHRFMTRFYSPKLVEDGLAAGQLARSGDRWAGFAWYTRFPGTFMREAVARHVLFLCGFLPTVFLARPRALAALPSVLRNSAGLPDDDGIAYLLTTGVAPGLRRSGHATLLAEAMVEDLRGAGAEAVEATVDRSNQGALRFYTRFGFEITDETLEGGSKVQIRYALR